MAYDDKRSYVNATLVAQNVIATASAQVVTSTQNAVYIPIAEATFITSLAAICTVASSNFPTGVKLLLLQTNTTTIGATGALVQTANAMATFTLNPPVAVPANTWLNLVWIATGTASATESCSAVNVVIGMAPQFV